MAVGFYNMSTANVFKIMGGQCFENMRRPMLLILAEHIMEAVSGRPSPNGAGGFRRRPNLGHSLCAPLVVEALATVYFKSIATHFFESIGHPHTIKAASHYLFKILPCRLVSHNVEVI